MPKKLLLTLSAALILAAPASARPRLPMWMACPVYGAWPPPSPLMCPPLPTVPLTLTLTSVMRSDMALADVVSLLRVGVNAPLWECRVVDHTAAWSLLPWW